MEEYPYFIYPDVIALKEGNCSPELEMRHKRRIAANVGDIAALRLMLGIDPEEFAGFYPDMAKVNLSTEDTIDSFLSRFGRPDAPTPKAAAEIRIPDEAVTEDSPIPPFPAADDDTSSAIDAFLKANPAPKVSPDLDLQYAAASIGVTAPPSLPNKDFIPGNTDFSLAGAQKLIKNHNYQAALEIIMQLSLNNPEKSIYFADQIRFLKKLILNEAKQNKRQG